VNQAAAVAAWIVAMSAASLGLGKLIQVLWRGFRKLGWFLDAALGEPAQGNVPARPGMLDRLTAIESEVAAVVAAVNGRLAVVDGFDARLTALEQRFPVEVPAREGV